MKKYVLTLINCIICMFILGAIVFSCCGAKAITNYGLNVTQVQLQRYDTISSETLNQMIAENALPKLSDWQTTNLTNYEENENYVFYFYYDKEHEQMMSLKRLISKNDTSYVFVSKKVKFEE